MAVTQDWLLELPRVTRTYYRCVKASGSTQRDLKKLVKKNPKKAAAIKRRVLSCMVRKHPFLKGPREWERVSARSVRGANRES